MAKKNKYNNKVSKARKNRRQRSTDVEQILLQKRQLFLTGVIDEDCSVNLIKEFLSLDQLSVEPITLWINSPGGSVPDGFAIVDIIKGLRSPVITVVNGVAASMAAVISVAGARRYITPHSSWMAHDLASYIEDYATKIIARTEYIKDIQKKLFLFLGKHTKLSESDLIKAQHEELWLNAEDCLKKGIVDEVFAQ